MERQPEKRWGLLGSLRTAGPGDRPPKPTPRAVVAEAGRLAGRLAGWAVAATVAAGVGYLGWGETGAWFGAAGVAGVLGVRLAGEAVLRAWTESP
ncbi:MAG TPA: hypothetical protein VGF55_00760 [Gemmataceae bacterium]|jgi:hypothetical protein